jgi:hypothetical protein
LNSEQLLSGHSVEMNGCNHTWPPIGAVVALHPDVVTGEAEQHSPSQPRKCLIPLRLRERLARVGGEWIFGLRVERAGVSFGGEQSATSYWHCLDPHVRTVFPLFRGTAPVR